MSIPHEDGVYTYSNGKWTKVRVEGPYVPEVDGVYVLYFRNTKCGGCKAFDREWLNFISMYNSLAKYVLVQCRNFFIECSDAVASDSFIFYLVLETPQVLLIVVENGLPVYIEREVGVLTVDQLSNLVLNANNRMKYALEEIEDEEEGVYIDLSTKNWKEVVEQLKKILIEGKVAHEICTSSGCRILIE